MSNKELLPCPFCNGEAIVKESKFGFSKICCYSCGARVTALYMGDAVKAWNRRATTCKKSLQVARSDFETLEKAYHNALDAYHDVAEQLEELKARSRQ